MNDSIMTLQCNGIITEIARKKDEIIKGALEKRFGDKRHEMASKCEIMVTPSFERITYNGDLIAEFHLPTISRDDGSEQYRLVFSMKYRVGNHE